MGTFACVNSRCRRVERPRGGSGSPTVPMEGWFRPRSRGRWTAGGCTAISRRCDGPGTVMRPAVTAQRT